MPDSLVVSSPSSNNLNQSVPAENESTQSYCSRFLRRIQLILCCRRHVEATSQKSGLQSTQPVLGGRSVSSATLLADQIGMHNDQNVSNNTFAPSTTVSRADIVRADGASMYTTLERLVFEPRVPRP